MSPQERDRNMQVWLAQARGPVRNGDLLRHAVDLALQVRAIHDGDEGRQPVTDALVETLAAVTSLLVEVGAAYAVAGSVASSVHGEPRSSVSVDLIVSASPEQVHEVAEKLKPRFCADVDGFCAAAAQDGFVNLIDHDTTLEVVLTFIEGQYPDCALRRRVPLRIGAADPESWFLTREDVILMGLSCRERTQSATQWENALNVARVRGARMDWKYLFAQARELGIEDDLVKLRDEAGI